MKFCSETVAQKRFKGKGENAVIQMVLKML